MATVYRKCDTNRISHKRPLIMGYSLTYYSALPQSDPPPFNCGSSATSYPPTITLANFAPVQGNNGQKLPSNSVLLLLLSSAGQKIKLLTVSLSTSHTVIHSTAHATTPQKRVTRRLHLFTGHKSTVNDLQLENGKWSPTIHLLGRCSRRGSPLWITRSLLSPSTIELCLLKNTEINFRSSPNRVKEGHPSANAELPSLGPSMSNCDLFKDILQSVTKRLSLQQNNSALNDDNHKLICHALLRPQTDR